MGGFGKAAALRLGLRHDWGSQYRAKAFQAEIKWLGIRLPPAYVGEPECNGVVERFISGWLLQRHGYLTPARAREKLSRRAA